MPDYEDNAQRLAPSRVIPLLEFELASGCTDTSLAMGIGQFIGSYCDNVRAWYKNERIALICNQMRDVSENYARVSIEARKGKIQELIALVVSLTDELKRFTYLREQRTRLIETDSEEPERYLEYLQDVPMDEQVRAKLAKLLTQKGRRAESIEHYEFLVQMKPEQDFYSSVLARLYRSAGNDEKARIMAQQSLSVNPNNPYSLMVMGELNWKSHQWEAAATCFKACVLIDKKNAYYVKRYVQSLLRMGQRETAKQLLASSIAEFPEDAELHHLYSELLSMEGDKQKAREELEIAADKNPHDPYVFSRRIAQQIKELPPSDAERFVAKIVSIPSHSENQFLHALHGELLLQSKRFEDAIHAFNRAYEANPGSMYYRNRLAQAYNELKHFEDAKRLLEQLAMQSGNRLSIMELCKALFGLKQDELGVQVLREALRLFPNDWEFRKMYFTQVKKLKSHD